VPEVTVERSPESKPELGPRKASRETWIIALIEILVIVGGFVAILGSALLHPGMGQLLLGMLGLVLVLTALAVLRKGH
jgi:hypothetical protein